MLDLALELCIVLISALIGGVISYRLKQPLIIGYLVIGVILGNILPGKYIESDFIKLIAELGVAFLLFSLGLEFSLRKVSQVGKTAVLGSILQMALCALVGFFVFPLFVKISPIESLFISILVSFSSTAVVAKILSERGALDSLHGEILLGWLIVQDLAVLPVMSLMPLLSREGLNVQIVLFSLLKPILLLYVVVFIGRKILPKLFVRLALLHNRELIGLLSFVFCVSFAYIANLLGLSFALGAFLAGISLSASTINDEVFTEVKSVRDIFSAVFFVSLGFLVSAPFLVHHIPIILLLSAIILLIKFVIVFALVLYLGYHSKVAFLVGIGLVQVGEFSFILAKIGLDKGILTGDSFQYLLSSAIFTVIVTPLLFSKSERFYNFLRKVASSRLPKLYERVFVRFDDLALYAPKDEAKDLKGHIILVGYGRVGRSLAHVLDKAKQKYLVVDLNYSNLKFLRNRGISNIFGDAEDEEVLKLAMIETAKVLIIAKPGKYENEHILRVARKLNSAIKIIVRVHSDEEAAHFVMEGVKSVVEPEFTASLEMAEKTLAVMGMSKEERGEVVEKVREEHRY